MNRLAQQLVAAYQDIGDCQQKCQDYEKHMAHMEQEIKRLHGIIRTLDEACPHRQAYLWTKREGDALLSTPCPQASKQNPRLLEPRFFIDTQAKDIVKQ